MKKRKNAGKIFLLIIMLVLTGLLAFAVSSKMTRDNYVQQNTPTEETVTDSILNSGTDSDFVIDRTEITDIFKDAVTVTVDEKTDLTRLCLNRFTIADDSYEAMMAQLSVGTDIWLWETAAEAFEQMYKAADEKGLALTPIDGYCGFDRQNRRYENKVRDLMGEGQSENEARLAASYFVLPAGHCEQYYGLTVWIGKESTDFSGTDEYIWLRNHAAEYGFIERYPQGKESLTYINYMPYAWRYVGVDAAKAITDGGLCLEEYLK